MSKRKMTHPVGFNYLASFATLLSLLLLLLQAETQPIANSNNNNINNNKSSNIYTCICNTQANPATLRLYCTLETRSI